MFGNVFSRFELSSLLLEKTPRCGSNSQTSVASPVDWVSQRRLSIPSSATITLRWVHRYVLRSLSNGVELRTDAAFNPVQAVSGPPQVIYAHLKYLWATGAREETLAWLREFTGKLSADLGIHPDGEAVATSEVVSPGRKAEYTRLLARCHYKLGEWQSAMQEDWGSVSLSRCFLSLSKLTRSFPLGCHSRHSSFISSCDESRSYLVQSVACVGSRQFRGRFAFCKGSR